MYVIYLSLHLFLLSSYSQANRTGFTHRQQLQLFREAVTLRSEGAGPFIPQPMYKPHTTSDRKRYVEDVLLEAPIYFLVEHSGQYGISLHDALHSRVKNLVNREQVVFEGRGPSVSIRLEVSQYTAPVFSSSHIFFFSGQVIDSGADRFQQRISVALLAP